MTGSRDDGRAGEALASGARFLARRALTRAEVRERLRARGHQAAEVEDALVRLEAAGALDDGELARRWIATRAGTRGHGRGRTIAELTVRGVDPAIAAAAWVDAVADGEVDEAATLARAVSRKLGHPGGGAQRGRVARVYNALLSEGFEPEALASALLPYGFERESE